MSKPENHWYLLRTVLQSLGKAMRPRVWGVGLWLVLVAAFVAAFQAGGLQALLRHADSPAFVPVFTVLIVGVSVTAGILLARWRQESVRSGYVKALQQPTPDALLQVVERSMSMSRALPDIDALSAQSKALAYALYGMEREAARALEGVQWSAKAPLIQAIGLSAEGIIALLCHRDIPQALELTRKARARASIHEALPGAAQTERYHNTCVAVAEVLQNVESPRSVKWLEESAADARFPPLQLLASFGLRVALERAGNLERAAQLRAFLQQTAPHCAPLHREAGQLTAPSPQPVQPLEGAMSRPLSPASGDSSVQQRSAKRTLLKAVGGLVGLWVVLLVMYFVLYAFFSQPR